jgi:hypothetical protein
MLYLASLLAIKFILKDFMQEERQLSVLGSTAAFGRNDLRKTPQTTWRVAALGKREPHERARQSGGL